MYEVSKCAPQQALRNLDKAFKVFFRNCKNKIKGKKGFPKFKSKHHGLGSFALYGAIHVFENEIQLPRLGKIKLKEKKYLPSELKILSATVSEKAGHWFVSVQAEETDIRFNKNKNSEIGIDLGINKLAVCSDGTVFENHKALRKNLKRLKRRQRRLSRKVKGSNNRNRARKMVAKLHYKISNIRKDSLHKITIQLTKSKSKIVIENLSIKNMIKNHCLAQAISDVGWYEFRRQLEYKGKWYNCEIVVADKFFPGSKTCSFCGNKKNKLKLSDRVYCCDACGLEIDRDLNASINLEYYTGGSPEINACGENDLCLDSSKQVDSLKQEANVEFCKTSNYLVNPVSFVEQYLSDMQKAVSSILTIPIFSLTK